MTIKERLYRSESLLEFVSYLLVITVKLITWLPGGLKILLIKMVKICLSSPKERIQLELYEAGTRNHSPKLQLISAISGETSGNIQKNICKAFIKQYLKNDWYGTTAEAHPMVMAITPSTQCSDHCDGCYASNYSRSEKLSPGIKRQVTGQAEEMYIRVVFISGGEPFEDTDTIPYCLDFPNLVFIIFTNGKAIDMGIAKGIRKAGNIIPIIGVDGLEKTNDRIRGEKSFELAKQAMKKLAGQKVFFGVGAVAGKRNINEITGEPFIREMVESKARFIWYNLYQPIGGEPDFEMMLSPLQRKEMYYKLKSLQGNYPIFILDAWNLAWAVGGCTGAGKFNFHINNKGDLEPCNVIHFADSNIYKAKDLKEALHSDFFNAIREAQPFSENLFCTCLFKDHPDVLKDICERYGAYPTHDRAPVFSTSAHMNMMLRQRKEWRWVSRQLWDEIRESSKVDMIDLLCTREKRVHEIWESDELF